MIPDIKQVLKQFQKVLKIREYNLSTNPYSVQQRKPPTRIDAFNKSFHIFLSAYDFYTFDSNCQQGFDKFRYFPDFCRAGSRRKT